jgi:hypothetical protein
MMADSKRANNQRRRPKLEPEPAQRDPYRDPQEHRLIYLDDSYW